jgi:hypothetical protein
MQLFNHAIYILHLHLHCSLFMDHLGFFNRNSEEFSAGIDRQTGWCSTSRVSQNISKHGCERPPVRSIKGGFASFFLRSRPPLFSRRGLRHQTKYPNSRKAKGWPHSLSRLSRTPLLGERVARSDRWAGQTKHLSISALLIRRFAQATFSRGRRNSPATLFAHVSSGR